MHGNYFTSWEKTLLASDLRKRTFSWDKDDFGLNSLLSLRWTKATLPKSVHSGRLQGSLGGEISSCCCERGIAWAGNQASWGHGKVRHGGTGSTWVIRVVLIHGAWSQDIFYILTSDYFMWNACVCAVHQWMPGHQAAGSGSVLIPQFSHIPVVLCVGPSRECTGAGAHQHQPGTWLKFSPGRRQWVEDAKGSYGTSQEVFPHLWWSIKGRYCHAAPISLQRQQ